jgi:hypothetical protein
MNMPITGGCLCKQLRYEIAAQAPMVARVCWCRVCQYIGAGSGTANAVFPKEAFTITGERKSYTSIADSGAVMHRSFCPDCGTPVFSEAEPRPHVLIVRVGTLDDPELGKPVATIWTSSAPSWACTDATLPRFEEAAPAK